jgi:DNA-binding NarL/FixJ family response regulator
MILFIDDERRYVRNYIEELQLVGFEIKFINNLADAENYIQLVERDNIELLVLDVMMPSGKLAIIEEYDEELDNGLGFYKIFRSVFPKTKVFILTNVTRQNVRDFFEKEKNCVFFEKDGDISDFVRRVKEELNFIS